MPKYAFHLDNYQIVDYYDNIPIKAERVVFIVDSGWEDRLRYNMIGHNMEQNFNVYSKNEIAKFDDLYYIIPIYEYKNLQIQDKNTKTEKTLGPMDKLVGYNNITSPNR